MKICPKCEQEKELSEFHKAKNHKDGFRSICKICVKEYGKSYRNNNAEKLKNQRFENREKIQKWNKAWFVKNKEYKKIYDNNRRKINAVKIAKQSKKYKQEHKEQIKKANRKYFKRRREIDINFKITGNLRTRLNKAITRESKFTSVTKLIGCSIKELKNYLEARFVKNMTFDNYGKWHIDHIKPCDSFDLSKEIEQRKCFHYSNLQPLWKLDNLRKSNH